MRLWNRKFAALVASVLTVTGVSSLTGSTVENERNRSYLIYSYNQEHVLTNSGYTLNLERYVPTSTYALSSLTDRPNYTHSGVVKLNMNGNGLGTGFVVGDHTIATAAHCIFDEETRTYAQDMHISLYDDDGNLVKTLNKSNNTIQAHIPTLYTSLPVEPEDENYQYDYALITVSEDLSDYEHFELGEVLASAAHSTEIPVMVCGYSEGTLKIDEGRLAEIYDRHFFYDTVAIEGDSGGPVFVPTTYIINTNVYSINTVIGIHTYNAGTLRQGNLITPEMRQFYLSNPYNTFEE